MSYISIGEFKTKFTNQKQDDKIIEIAIEEITQIINHFTYHRIKKITDFDIEIQNNIKSACLFGVYYHLFFLQNNQEQEKGIRKFSLGDLTIERENMNSFFEDFKSKNLIVAKLGFSAYTFLLASGLTYMEIN